MAGPEERGGSNGGGDLKDEDVVAVGSISNVLRRAFLDYYTSDFDKNLNAEWADDVAPDTADGSSVTATDSEGREETNQDDTTTASRIAPDHPYLVLAKERVAAIDANLREKVTQASDLMALLESRRQDAAKKDEQQARELIAQGLVVKAQIPIGPSNFTLHRDELLPFGEFATSLIHARDLLQANHERMLDRSGNGPTAQIKAAKAAIQVPGYLSSTASVSIRKGMTLPKSTAPAHSSYDGNHDEDEEYVSEFVDDDAAVVPSSSSTITTNNNVSNTSNKYKPTRMSKRPPPTPTLSTEAQLLNAKILTRMQSTLQFPRNPRYDKSNDSINELAPSFVVEPNPVEFTSYDMGGIYEQLVLLKNVSSLSGRCRILPPSSTFFMLASVLYPDSSGLIAPGLTCQVRVQFAPDTRADYSDSFVVMIETPSGTDIPLQVPLAAHRDPPRLSLPSTLLASCCLIGGTSTTTISCLNSGGRGRFWLVSDADWGVANVLDNIHALQAQPTPAPAALSIGPFTLSPCDMDLGTGDAADLTLVYTPTVVGTESATFYIVCDNCLVKPFKVAGRGCEIDIAPVTINRVPIEATVASMGPLDRLLFAPIMTHAMATQTFQVVNHTPLALPFEWVVVDKHQHQLQLMTSRHATTNHHICEEDKQGQLVSARLRVPFEIAPSTGVLGQGATATFVVTFTPTTVASFGALASLTICHVPPCCLPGAARNNGREDSAALTTVDAMQLTLEGASMPSAIHLNPWIVSFGGDTCLNRDIAAPLVMSNHGPTAVAFRWGHHSQQQHDDNDDDAIDFGGKHDLICHVEPSEGTVPAHGTCTVVVHVTPHRTGRFGFPVTCAVEASSQVVAWVQGHVPRPHIRLLAPEIDFGLVSVGNTATQVLRFQNDSATVATYRFSHVGPPGFVPLLKRTNSTDSMASSRFSFVTSSDASTTDDKPDVPHKCVLSFHPEDGTLQPGEEGMVSIVCTSGKYPERFRGSVQCEVVDAATTCISARGEIQCPQVYLSQTKVALGTTYIGVPVTRTLALVNVSNLPAPFKWVEPLGKSKAYSVEFHPRSGTLESKQSLHVTIVFTGRAPGLTDVVFSCQVRGVLVPLGFELVTLQKGLVLSYQLVDDTVSQGTAVVSPDAPVGSSLPKLHFGEHVPLFARKSLRLLIRNHSGIPAKLSLEARKYNTTLPDNATIPPQASSLEPRDKAFQSESGRQYKSNQANVHQDRMLLSAGLGVALLCAPSTVSIAPWEQTVVTVTALNNMSGRYVDDIVVKLDTMPPVRLSATINVVGCPLSINPNCVGLRMHHDPRFPLLEFGILPLQADIVTRKVQVINTGPIPAKVTWKLAEYRDPDAVERVVDVTVAVGPRNLVDVRIRLHVQKDDIAVPFTVEPMERVIAKHDHANFVMTFHPQSCPVGVARALVVADAEWLHGENAAVYRPDSSLSNQSSTSSLMMGAVGKALKAVRLTNALGKAKPGGALNFKSVACVQLAVTGEIVPPALHWDKASPSRATFTTWSLHPPTHPAMFQTMQLVNRLATKLTFRLDTAGPFSIVQATAAANNHHHPLSASVVSPTSRPLAFNQHPTPSFTLGPSQSVQVHVQFHPPPTPSTTAITLPATSLSTAVSLSGHLGIRFSHGSVQTIALQGRVLRPQLVLAPSQFHFGRVHCERTHTIRVFLANPTEVDVHFTVRHHHHTPSSHQLQPPHPSAADDDPTVFQIATMSGTLRGPTLPLHTAGAAVPTPSPDYAAAIHPPMEIVVTFAPSQPKKYKSRFRFDVVMGDGFDLVLEGEGTLVEHKQQPSGSRAVPRAAPLRHSHYMLGKVKE
ncbi:hypothetical protein H257_15541 [Aphanomyces astaci]|uniref:Deleted in lung and esophageal cancer protein 1 Ig-like domain-containing protein n=1 Tax=Aphanomyces astaci TaxID=112090 RepID=W4FM73_APHAT|nr:hypothetical protein H257_15541 [Aphanomyces astaci]ETV68555.1 hypothetical protein H257_15541 [Aphanomyces astaci]RQM27153.1 hypothetical protein B5M09_006592 [Aphanomyces astaci]|eukprot:XP_009841984.1 hypothetical protein H257_15541 [Aphanomyces astaci]